MPWDVNCYVAKWIIPSITISFVNVSVIYNLGSESEPFDILTCFPKGSLLLPIFQKLQQDDAL